MRRIWASLLLLAVVAGLALMWLPQRWAVAVSQIAVFTVGIAWISSKLGKKGAFFVDFGAILPLGMLVLGALQLTLGWTVSPSQTTEAVLYWATNLCVFAVASSMSRDPAVCRFFWKWIFVGGVAVSVFSLVHNFTSGGLMYWVFRARYQEDLWGPFLYRNQYAAFIELLLPIAWYRSLTSEDGRWPYLVSTAALLSCVVACASRAGLAIAIAELLFLAALLWVRERMPLKRLALAAVPLVLLGSVFAAVVGPERVWMRVRNDPAGGRGELNQASTAMWRDRPVTGFGLGAWPTVYPSYALSDDGTFANQAHNDWAQAGVEGGVPAVLCLLAFFLWAVRAGWRAPWGFGLSFVLLHALVDYPIQRQALGVMYFLVAGILARSGRSAAVR
jgi:O-antigen ligase